MTPEIIFPDPIIKKVVELIIQDSDLKDLFRLWCISQNIEIDSIEEDDLYSQKEFITQILILIDFSEQRDGLEGLEDLLPSADPILRAEIGSF